MRHRSSARQAPSPSREPVDEAVLGERLQDRRVDAPLLACVAMGARTSRRERLGLAQQRELRVVEVDVERPAHRSSGRHGDGHELDERLRVEEAGHAEEPERRVVAAEVPRQTAPSSRRRGAVGLDVGDEELHRDEVLGLAARRAQRGRDVAGRDVELGHEVPAEISPSGPSAVCPPSCDDAPRRGDHGVRVAHRAARARAR